MKTQARRVEKRFKQLLLLALQRMIRVAPIEKIEDIAEINTILLIRPNFRLGNTLMSAPVIDAFRERFPEATIDYLTTDSALPLLKHRPADHFYMLSRKAILRPWQAVALLRRLRAKRYDLAVQVSGGSTTGLVVTQLIKARYTMGARKRHARWYSLETQGRALHNYDAIVDLTRPLGVACRNRPLLELTPRERLEGEARLAAMWTAQRPTAQGPVAIFVGGHADKRWPLSFWKELLAALEASQIHHVVFLGPEEFRLSRPLQEQLSTSRYAALCQPLPVRQFASVLSGARLLVTPDSGPMHLAAALGIPAVSLIRQRCSLAFVPREPFDIMLWQPSVLQVITAIHASMGQGHAKAA
ncbi:glycosyltransferase family 9 protein [Halomonas sp. HMF6819]|uniref:glycosyltransferase family 9 protein n=1 Tax=Halomonas sp. HMF6819 TaxID=3373085 RepID=UPI00379B4133